MRHLGYVLLLGFGAGYEKLAGRLVLMNFRGCRAETPPEAHRAFEDPARPIRAVLVQSQLSIDPADTRALRRSSGDRGVVVVGPRPDAEGVRSWKDAGASHALWEPIVDGELRFVLNELTHDASGWASRAAPRVPTSLMARVHSATGQKPAIVYNLSVGGAYLETPRPTASGGHVSVELPLPDGELELEAVVVASNVPGNLQRPNLPVGMGVRFVDAAPEAQRALQSYVSERERELRF